MSGFFGCVSRRPCVADVFYGTDYHSHLGTKRAGMAFCDGGDFSRSIHSLESAYFRNKFEADLPRFGQARSGVGVISDTESQPITLTSHLGRFSVVTIGRIDNIDELAGELLSHGINFAEMSSSRINATELVAILISLGDSYTDGMRIVQEKVKGSCSLMILTDAGIYAMRDKLGRTPVALGRDADGHVVATENSSFANLGYDNLRELGPGEAVLVTAEAVGQVIPPGDRKQICSFMWVYYGYPSSSYEGVNVEASRYRCGCALARRDSGSVEADIVAGIPDSGVGHAIGYSHCAAIPYKRAFVKYTPTWPRSFMPQNQNMRDLVAKMKLIPNRAIIDGASMVLLDDSIVRGTQLKDNIVKLTEAGGEKVHIRIACPPLVYPCVFLNFSTSRSTFDLITRRTIKELEGTEGTPENILAEYADPDSERYARMIDRMREVIGADSLRFQRLDDLVAAIGLPREELCTHCWDNSSYF